MPPPVVRKELVAAFERALDARLVPGELRPDERESYRWWAAKMRSRDWLNEVRLDTAGTKRLRITGHVHMGHGVHKAPGGLIRVTLMVASNRVVDALVSGDFTAVGADRERIANALLGPAGEDEIRSRLDTLWPSIDTPGVTASDVLDAARPALAPAPAMVGA